MAGSGALEVCKLCLDHDDKIQMISPCKCKGSIKYVHAHCMASWRSALLQCGRDDDLYRCTICHHPLLVKPKSLWVGLLNYRATRVSATLAILALILVPLGALMKLFIHVSVMVSNLPKGRTITDFFGTTTTHPITTRVLYSPFPVCFRASLASNHSLLVNRALYYMLFPFSDDRFWHLVLCRLEHFHLGLFFLGSTINIWFMFRVLSDIFDILLSSQDHDPPPHEDRHEREPEQPLDGIAARLRQLFKGALLAYCCALVVLFWVHFNLLAFHAETRLDDMATSGEMEDTTRFVAELPLWTLRWVTLGVAVGDFAARGIYRWVGRATCSVEKEDVLSMPENE